MNLSPKIVRHLPQRIRVWLIEQGWAYPEKPGNGTVLSERELEKQLIGKGLPIRDLHSWCRRLHRMMRFRPSLEIMAKEFYSCDLKIIRSIEIADGFPIIVCLQKDDVTRVQAFVKYHRSIGFRYFAFIDNGSADGSFEWLHNQDDVFLFRTEEPYTSANRDAWINRVLAYFGDNRWYAVLDSDEFLSYEDCENKNIDQVISYLKSKKIMRARSMMLDMYAKDGYFERGNRGDFLTESVYFDSATYTTAPWDCHVILSGGPRKRLFNTNATLTKYPLFFLSDGEVLYQAHAMFPLWKNLNSPCFLVIRHYKFLPGDKLKFEKIAKDGKYYGGSIEYKQYVARMSDSEIIRFTFEGTEKYVDSSSLRVIPNYDAIEWDDSDN